MDDERPPALEPPEEVLPTSLDGRDPLSDERFGDEKRVQRPRQACVDDLGARDRRADEHRCKATAHRLDLGQLRHPRIVWRARRLPLGDWSLSHLAAIDAWREDRPFATVRPARAGDTIRRLQLRGLARLRGHDQLHARREHDARLDLLTIAASVHACLLDVHQTPFGRRRTWHEP